MRRAGSAIGLALTLAAGALTVGRAHAAATASCAAPLSLMAIEPALVASAARIRQGDALTIVAVGSSSTEGIGASSPDHNYPTVLASELHERFPTLTVRVINRGKGGEDAGEEMARLEPDVIADHPDLVIWQVGTNAVLRHDDLTADGEIIERGVARLKQSGSDVVLMDLQDAPRVIARRAHGEMEALIAGIAKRNKVGLFRRFDIMRHWEDEHPADSAMMIGPDGLHMTDYGYGCLAAHLAEALAWNWWLQMQPGQHSAHVVALGTKPADANAGRFLPP